MRVLCRRTSRSGHRSVRTKCGTMVQIPDVISLQGSHENPDAAPSSIASEKTKQVRSSYRTIVSQPERLALMISPAAQCPSLDIVWNEDLRTPGRSPEQELRTCVQQAKAHDSVGRVRSANLGLFQLLEPLCNGSHSRYRRTSRLTRARWLEGFWHCSDYWGKTIPHGPRSTGMTNPIR